MRKPKRAGATKYKYYMCGVDLQEEMDPTIYKCKHLLKRSRPCWKSCGIVEVEVKVLRWPVKQDFSKMKQKPEAED